MGASPGVGHPSLVSCLPACLTARPPFAPTQTNDFGVAKDGRRKEGFQLGMALTARATLLAEGCRGSLSQRVMKRYGLRDKAGAQPQTYALGLKEVWQVSKCGRGPIWVGGGGLRKAQPQNAHVRWRSTILEGHQPVGHPAACLPAQVAPEKHKPGLVVHTVGWPLPWNVYGGSFIYHMADNRVALG